MKTHCLEPDLLWAPASGSSSLSIFPNASSHDLSFLIVLSRPPMKFCSSCTIMKHRSRSSPDRPHDPTARCKRSCTETWLKVNPQQTVLRVISYDVSTNSFYKLITVRKNQENSEWNFRMIDCVKFMKSTVDWINAERLALTSSASERCLGC